MPRIAPPTENQPTKTIGDPVDLRSWLDESEDIRDGRGRPAGKQYLNVPKEVRDELLKGKTTAQDINDRPLRLSSRNLEVSVEIARRKFGKDKLVHEMEFAVVRPLTLKGALMLMEDQGDPIFDGDTELPSVVRYFNKAWTTAMRDNANARMANIVEGIDKKRDQAIRTIASMNNWSYERAQEAFCSIVPDA